MIPYLKYYFESRDGVLGLNSLPIGCEEDEKKVPPDFVKWYEEGDIDWTLTEEQKELAMQCECPLFAAFYFPYKVNLI